MYDLGHVSNRQTCLIFTITLWGMQHYPHFRYEKTNAQRGQAAAQDHQLESGGFWTYICLGTFFF